MNNIRLIALSSLFYCHLAFAQTPGLTEADILAAARKESLAGVAADSSREQQRLAHDQFREKFDTSAFASLSYGETDREPANQFAPVMSPMSRWNVGARRALPHGLTTEFQGFGEQINTDDGMIDEATTSGFKLALRADLFKNFFGQLDRWTDSSLQKRTEQKELQAYLDRKSFEVDVRKLYWSLITNTQSQRIAAEQVALAKKQVAEAQRRAQLSIAEEDEVARYQAQLSAAKTRALVLDYQGQTLEMNLRQLVPALQGKPFRLAPINREAVTTKILECTEWIRKRKTIPWQETRADEALELARQAIKLDRNVLDRYDDLDLQLISQLEYTGFDKGYGDSTTAVVDDGRFGYTMGLELSMPIGEARSNTKFRQLTLKAKELQLQSLQLTSALKARHDQMGRLIALLYQTIEFQKASSGELTTVVAAQKKKYQQARASVDQIIRDQNALQSSLIDQTQTRLTVITELLEYFRLFTETPCSFNKIK